VDPLVVVFAQAMIAGSIACTILKEPDRRKYDLSKGFAAVRDHSPDMTYSIPSTKHTDNRFCHTRSTKRKQFAFPDSLSKKNPEQPNQLCRRIAMTIWRRSTYAKSGSELDLVYPAKEELVHHDSQPERIQPESDARKNDARTNRNRHQLDW
jgi:hypothetical protein